MPSAPAAGAPALTPPTAAATGPNGRVAANPRLDTGLLVGADNVVEQVQPFPFPVALVQVQHARGFGKEVGSTREDPVFVLPRLDGVGIQDALHGAPADRLLQFPLGLLRQIPQRLPTQGTLVTGDGLARQRRHHGPLQGGQKRTYAPAPRRPAGSVPPAPNAAAIRERTC